MTRMIEIQPGSVSSSLPEASFRVSHRLANHPLFQLDRLARLAASLPADRIEFNGPVEPNQDPNLTPSNGMTPEETVRRVEQAKSWMVLKNVEADPEYKALLDACLDQAAEQTGGFMGAALDRQAFIFVTSPGNVTPFHSDPEQNFLLQSAAQTHVAFRSSRSRDRQRRSDSSASIATCHTATHSRQRRRISISNPAEGYLCRSSTRVG